MFDSRPCHWKGQFPRFLPVGCSFGRLHLVALVALFHFSVPVIPAADCCVVVLVAVDDYHCCAVVQEVVENHYCCVVVLVVVEDYRCFYSVVFVVLLVGSSIALVGQLCLYLISAD